MKKNYVLLNTGNMNIFKKIIIKLWSIIWFIGIVSGCATIEKSYYPNERIESEVGTRNGVYDGQLKKWYADGTTSSVQTFVRGIHDGPFITYFQNGQKQCEGSFSNGKMEGWYLEWYETGALKKVEHYLSGFLYGDVMFFSEQGNLLSYVKYSKEVMEIIVYK